ncbi:heat stress transcription factor b-4 [Phtheirospermum japonicum]|uniref:Heat stress transcription factor b-4 n=1 Tax=Phtheirospermum japonicum TaxID=374723 RepID=A0A830BPP6_9LAMI|nr:heat stress transcription factor b-4 [Phtheirospermum japonicum]
MAAPDSDEQQIITNNNNWFGSPSAANSSSFIALSEDNQRLRRNNNMLVSELAHMRKLYNDIIYFVQNHVNPVSPSSSMFHYNSSSSHPLSSQFTQKPLNHNQIMASKIEMTPQNKNVKIIDEPRNFEEQLCCRTKLFGVPLFSKKRLHSEYNSSSSFVETNKTRFVLEKDDLGLSPMPPSSC